MVSIQRLRGGAKDAKVALALTEFGGLKKRKSIINYLVFYNDDGAALIRKIAQKFFLDFDFQRRMQVDLEKSLFGGTILVKKMFFKQELSKIANGPCQAE